MITLCVLTIRIFGKYGYSPYVCGMKNLLHVLRLMRRHLSLRLLNFAGLSVVLAALLISVNHVMRELSWDRYNTFAERIWRLTIAPEGGPVDGRIWGNFADDPIRQIPQVERLAKLHEVYRPDLKFGGKFMTAEEKVFYVNKDFLRTFDIAMYDGDPETALAAGDQVIVSESMARKLAAMQTGREMYGDLDGEGWYGSIIGADLEVEGEAFRISGIFGDIPETSHWRGDVLLPMPETMQTFCYTYLLLREGSDPEAVESAVTDMLGGMVQEEEDQLQARLMPLTDIHLHSRNLRELSVNGNIYYIWLLLGANVLLLVVVLFNLWLNNTLVFSYNRSFYRIHRLHGAPVSVILRYEAVQAIILCLASVTVGVALASAVSGSGILPGTMELLPTVLTVLFFIAVSMSVALFPVFHSMAMNGFLNVRGIHFTYRNVRWMLVVQYSVLIAVLSIAFGISRQLGVIEDVQSGGDGRDVLVMAGLPESAMERYPLLRERLAGNPLVLGMTTSFQLPGDAIRDNVNVRCGGSAEWVQIPVMMAGEGFLDFFGIPLLAGEDFSPLNYGFEEEQAMLRDFLMTGKQSDRTEEYIINRKALTALGFNDPQEAVGAPLEFRQGVLDYISRGVIAGVSDDYNYTGVFADIPPMIMLQRNMFQFCLMVRIDASGYREAVRALEEAWAEVFPDRESEFVPLSGIYRSLYRNEYNARELVSLFAVLCFVIADLGLIVFMAFIIRRRTKEIAVRKINGASAGTIVCMLNVNFIRYVCIAFAVAVPVSWYILNIWQQRFVCKALPEWWLFLLAGLSVMLLSILSVSFQSWRAANLNPVRGLGK